MGGVTRTSDRQRWRLPSVPAGFVTDGGMETDLIFHHGVDLPEFAAFPLLEHDEGRRLLRDYYTGYADIARRRGAGLLLESPTWRANPDWGRALGYDRTALHRVNVEAVTWLHDLAQALSPDLPAVVVSGMVGPRGDGYAASTIDPTRLRPTTRTSSRPSPRPVPTWRRR